VAGANASARRVDWVDTRRGASGRESLFARDLSAGTVFQTAVVLRGECPPRPPEALNTGDGLR
jgi:hypothetical protein